MSESNNTPVQDSTLAVTLTVGQLRELVREEAAKANGTHALETLLDAAELAKVLGLDVDYIYRQAQAGKIPSKKIGKYRKFQPSKIQSWLEKKNS